MTRTFLIAVELPDDADLNAIADDILELTAEQYSVASVTPWGQSLATTASFSGAPLSAPPSILG